jgi:hypothetical protein
MSHGPVDLLVVRFPDSNFTGEVMAEMKALVDAGTLRILDLIFVTKNDAGDLDVIELTDLEDVVASTFDAFVGDLEGLFSSEDIEALAAGLAPNASAGLALYENVWALKFAQAVRDANGEVLLAERIPRAVIEELEAFDVATVP